MAMARCATVITRPSSLGLLPLRKKITELVDHTGDRGALSQAPPFHHLPMTMLPGFQ